jgi:hypothetical protein
MKVEVRKEGEGFVAGPVDLPGMPYVGRGATRLEALGAFLVQYQTELGIQIVIEGAAIVVDQRASPAERAKRARDLGRR